MSTHRFLITVFLLMALVLPASAAAAQAQPPAPPPAPGGDWLPPLPDASADFAPAGLSSARTMADPTSDAVQTPDGLWMMPAEASSAETPARTTLQPANSGGPDDFGYTFNSVPLDWIDASGGIDTGINSSLDTAGPIAIGFPFKYYENTYGDLWVSRFGFLAFNDNGLYRSQSRIPDASLPNDVIAPHWIPSYESPNYVRYLRGGVAPNRWFVMEWNRQRSDCCVGDPASDEYTFQAILRENGDIVFQYRDMIVYGGYWCMASGIEDSTGLDGLSMTSFCNPVASNQATLIVRPAPAARVRIFPQHFGAFIYAGQEWRTQIPIRNTGELGADTYDLTLDTSWAAGLFHEDGVTPLTDSDGDGVIDTGPVAQADTKVVMLKVWSSSAAQAGDTNTALVTARSSLDTAKQRTATARITVPTSFAQVFRDNADGAMSLLLAKPQAQGVRQATDDYHYGYEMAVAELPNHNLIYAWSKGRCVTSDCGRYVYEIEYTILDPYGETVRPITRLVDHSGATLSTEDYSPAIAVAGDGRIGLVWIRYLYSVNGQHNYNIFWAALNANGALASGPSSVTNNTVWGTWSDLNVPGFYYPTIAVTGDNRFVLAWLREHRASAGWVDDIYFAIRDANGGVIKAVTKLTNDSPGDSAYYQPALAALSSNRVFLSWVSRSQGNDDIYYVVIGSNGALVKTATNLSVDEEVVDWRNWDAVQLSSGKIIAVWEAWGCFPGEWVPRIRFALLDTSYNRIGIPACLGKSEAAISGDTSASVTRDSNNRAVLTWMDNDYNSRRNLYYALVEANGTVLTPPTIFRTSQAYSPYIFSSYLGNGNTTFTWTPPAGVDSALSVGQPSAFGLPGSPVTPIALKLAGRGGSAATSVRLIATLDPRLRYVSDTSGVLPTVSGQTVTWNLPDLRLYDIRQFQLFLETTSAVLGDRLPVQLQLTSAEPDLTPANNQASVQVWVSTPVYLPVLLR